MAYPNPSPPETIRSLRAAHDTALDLSAQSPFWRDASPIFFEGDNYGRPVRQLRTEVRSRWTDSSLYLLFVCPYLDLNLKPSPQTKTDTNHLWNWDVAEAFIGSDFQHIRRYKEFELSPQNEWLDLDIDLDQPHRDGSKWNSGFKTAARIDPDKKIWYGAMRIPFTAIDPNSPIPAASFALTSFAVREPRDSSSPGRPQWANPSMCPSASAFWNSRDSRPFSANPVREDQRRLSGDSTAWHADNVALRCL